MRGLLITLVLLTCGCEKPLVDNLREQGYTNVVPWPQAACPGESLDEGARAERYGRVWEIAKCCHTTLITTVGMCGKTTCTHLTPTRFCNVRERDLGPAEVEHATPWPE